MLKKIKKVVSLLLVFNLIIANFNGAIFGLIAYAENETTAETVQEDTEVETTEEFINKDETVENEINYTKTYAELGIENPTIPTGVEQEVNFTITLHTENIGYDLFKNPEFLIELPKEVTNVKIPTNGVEFINDTEIMDFDKTEDGLINGNKAIYVKLKGEQTEYTKNNLDNIQIQVKANITTEKLIPTTKTNVNLHYINENAVSYDGEQKITSETEVNGIDTVEVTLASEEAILAETKLTIERTETKIASSLDVNQIQVDETIKEVKVTGTVINNKNENIENASINLQAQNINNLIVETENASIEENKIVIDNFEVGEKIVFSYTIQLPDAVEAGAYFDTTFVVKNSAGDNLKTSTIRIIQDAKKKEEIKDDVIEAKIDFKYGNAFELTDRVFYNLSLQNLVDTKLENIDIEITIPEEMTKVIVPLYRDTIEEDEENEIVKIEDGKIIIEDLYLEANELLNIPVSMDIDKFIDEKAEFSATLKYGEKENVLTSAINVIGPSIINTTITSNKEGKTLEEGEEIEYIFTLENKGKSSAVIDAIIPNIEELKIYNVEIKNKTTNETTSLYGNITESITQIEIDPGETVEIIFKCFVKNVDENSTIAMYLKLTGTKIIDTETEKLENFIKQNESEENGNSGNSGDSGNSGGSDNSENSETPVVKNNTVLGIAWVDSNENGIKDSNEIALKGVQAILVNTKTLERSTPVITDSNGKYEFNNVTQGTYIVEFKFNTVTFKLTDYQKGITSKDIDSDVIATTQNNETINKTEEFELIEKGYIFNIGLIVNKKFDMSISKGVTKVTVDNKLGTKVYNFEHADMAKVEISENYFKGSMVLVEYEITVANKGEVSGYVKQISDQIPEGMKFNSELNTNWYEGENGKIYTNLFENEELEPGEEKTIKLILTQEIKEDKLVSTMNTAEIEKTYNEYLITDKEDENNISDATLIVSIKTGGIANYMWLVLLVIAIIGSGTFVTIKILNKETIK